MSYHETPSCGNRVVPWSPTDMTKLVADFRNFANALKNWETGGFYTWSLFYLTNIFCHDRALFESACGWSTQALRLNTIKRPDRR
jgi:hypothetical protein